MGRKPSLLAGLHSFPPPICFCPIPPPRRTTPGASLRRGLRSAKLHPAARGGPAVHPRACAGAASWPDCPEGLPRDPEGGRGSPRGAPNPEAAPGKQGAVAPSPRRPLPSRARPAAPGSYLR